ncbi:hypothetical protein [Micromonospora sp. HUAS LYJ1]|uniref:hypothetical protein n=1 Tax=Micromonospora sp. HUAS LYJ1 TaxID=3061626 RepID=UPI0026736999|nr:hypothetical protein [Micromonospora sp. HUAS LYJ1]WKU08004.1 hypothetical protein Q2K16_13725 [Micromonospora sp. HUAS LYJ1]
MRSTLPAFVNPLTGEPVTPGTVLGYRRDGRPIYVIAGGSGEGGDGGSGGEGGSSGDGSTGEGGDDTSTTKTPKIEGEFDPERHARALAAARDGERKAKAESKAKDERIAAILQAAGLTPDGKTDPAEQLKAAAAERDSATQKLRDKSLRLAVRENADKAGVDPTALLDSASFRAATAELDPDAADYDDQVVAAMKKALKANSRLAANAGQGAGRQGADHTGGGTNTGRPKSLREAFARQNQTT